MSHCLCCSGFVMDYHQGYSVSSEPRKCPGCGHESLERQLAEAQAEVSLLKHHVLREYQAENDALRAKVFDLEQRFDLEVHQQVDMQTRALRAKLEQAWEALDRAHSCATLDSITRKCQGCFVSDTLATLDAGNGDLLGQRLQARKLRAVLGAATSLVLANVRDEEWFRLRDAFVVMLEELAPLDAGEGARDLSDVEVQAKRALARYGAPGESLLVMCDRLAWQGTPDAGKGAAPTAWLCTVERPGLASAPDKHHPDCPLVRKDAGG